MNTSFVENALQPTPHPLAGVAADPRGARALASWGWLRRHWWQGVIGLCLLGPIQAPLSKAAGLWPLTAVADFINALGVLICPLAYDTPRIAGQPMSVCPLCYGALLSIFAVSLNFPRPQQFWRWWHGRAWGLRLTLAVALLPAWLGAYVVHHAGLVDVPFSVMWPLGLLGGLGVALLGEFLWESAV
jgi:hypothetical protein